MVTKPKILIVDDDNFMLQFVRAMLDEETYEILITKSPADSLSIIHSKRPDVVISDIEMPGIQGTELIKVIHEINPQTPVIFISSLERDGLKQELIEAGSFGFISKPVEPEKLENMVKRALSTINRAA